MKEQTPMQELIVFLESEIEDLKQSDVEEDKNVSNYLYAVILSTTRRLLEKEKQLVIDAFVEGNREVFYHGTEEVLANEYFNNKYNTK